MTTAMGPLPAVTGCCCRICLPRRPFEDPHDADDRLCIDTVVRAGWQVVVVGGGGTCSCCGDEADPVSDEPAFAYTIGLQHRAGHPELAMSGLPSDTMHLALNALAERVVEHGDRVRPGDIVETLLSNAPVTIERVSDTGVDEIGLGSWSSWFHRGRVEVLQLVWPTRTGIFPWQPGAPAEMAALQPPSWRVPSARRGALAADPPWPFPVPPDEVIITCTHIREQNEPVRFVARTRGDEGQDWWDVHCGREHGPGVEELLSEHLAHTVRAAPSVRAVADLRIGEYAERADAFSSWRRGRIRR